MDQQASAAMEQLAAAVAAGDRARVLLLANSLSGAGLVAGDEVDLEMHRALAAVLAEFGAVDPAMDVHARVLEAMAAGTPDPRDVLVEIDALVALAESKGDMARAARLQAIAVDLTRAIDGEDSPALRARLRALASLRMKAGQGAAAAAAAAEASHLEARFGASVGAQPEAESLSPIRKTAVPVSFPAAAAPAPAPAPAPAAPAQADISLETVTAGAARGPAVSEAAAVEANYRTVEVFFSTSRKPTGSDNPYYHFSGRRNGDLTPVHTYGIADVSVPAHRKVGSLPVPGWFNRYAGYQNDDLYLLKKIRELSRTDFDGQLADRITSRPGGEGLLFIHGFNVAFWGAMVRAAQLSADLDIDGAVAAYSWPSRGNVLCYLTDRQEIIDPHVEELKRMIMLMGTAKGVRRVTIIAHSMGCEFLLRALKELQIALASAPGRAAPLVKDVIFAAPDVDLAQFAAVVPKLGAVASRVSVYCSERDTALAWGRRLVSTYDRAGNQATQLAAALAASPQPVDTIDTTEASTGLLGHADFASSAIDDLRAVVWLSLIPQRRPTLVERSKSSGPSYWVYKPASAAPDTAQPFRQALLLARQYGSIAKALAAVEAEIAGVREKPGATPRQAQAYAAVALALTAMA